jgi:GalNAc-alpha-(1->4)-GalNAc-alpha-(1->3)-diNAcBac-PP-undecaprenol alpha-1,4-N-acetyl-D-galactosaminyltransferase
VRIIFPFVGDTVGGSHHSAALLMKELRSLGIEPLVLIHQPGPLALFFDRSAIPYEISNLPFWHSDGGLVFRTIRALSLIPRLFLRLRHCRPEVVHVNDGRMAISWALPCLLAGVRLIIHQRTCLAPSRAYKFALLLASRVVSISEFTENSLPNWAKKKSRLLFNPFESVPIGTRSQVREDVRSELELGSDSRIIVFVGTIQEQKRPLVALKALAQFRQSGGENAALLMIGRISNEDRQTLSSMIEELKLDNYVKILGFRDDVSRFIMAADVLVAPAIGEGHGRVVVEAMLAGTPVVASASGGHLEIIEHRMSGLLFPPDDARALADALLHLFVDSENSARLSSNAFIATFQKYSKNKHASDMFLIYRQTLGRVAIVIESMGGGGAQQVVGQLLSKWVDRGDSPVLITFNSNHDDSTVIPLGVELHRVDSQGPSNGWRQAVVANLARLWRIRRAIKNTRARRVVSFVTATNVLAILATIGLRVKVIVSERNDPLRQDPGRSWSVLRRLLYPFAWRVTANTRSALTAFAGHVSSRRLEFVPNPVRQKVNLSLSEATEPPFVLAVGRLHPQKNYPILFKAFAKADLLGWRLRVLGEGIERDKLLTLASDLGIAERLDLMGYVEDPFPHYLSARLFVMASAYEGSPNALWEAMGTGLPALVSDTIDGVREICDGGQDIRFFSSGEVLDLTRQLVAMSDSLITPKRSKQNVDLVARKFAIDDVFLAWDKVIFKNI